MKPNLIIAHAICAYYVLLHIFMTVRESSNWNNRRWIKVSHCREAVRTARVYIASNGLMNAPCVSSGCESFPVRTAKGDIECYSIELKNAHRAVTVSESFESESSFTSSAYLIVSIEIELAWIWHEGGTGARKGEKLLFSMCDPLMSKAFENVLRVESCRRDLRFEL